MDVFKWLNLNRGTHNVCDQKAKVHIKDVFVYVSLSSVFSKGVSE